MATLNIEGVGRVTVDDAFLKLSPEDQAKTVDEIVSSVKPKAPAPAPAPAPKQSGSLLKTIDDAVRGAADTLTFGYADEIAAKLDQLTGLNTANGGKAPATYDEALAAQRARDAEGGAARTVGQVGGALLPITKGAQLAKAGLAKLGITPTAVKTGAVTGGVSSGLYGSGSAEGDVTDRVVEGAAAVPVGAALGAAAPVVLDKAMKAGGAVVDKVKDVAGVKVPVEKLAPEVQDLLAKQAPELTEVTPKAAKALEKLSNNPQSVASDIRVRELFLSEKARVTAADPQRAIPDDVVFKNVGDKLKQTANSTVEALAKAGDLDTQAAKEAKTIISRAARHNRAITGELKDEELAAELAKGFRTDAAAIDAMNIPRAAKEALKDAIKDLDTVTFNSLKKNQGGIFQNIGGIAGRMAGSVGGNVGSMIGQNVGAGTGRLVDKVLLQQGTAPVLKRTVDRIAQGLDEAGVNAGDTVKGLQDAAMSSTQRAAAKALAEKQAADALKAQSAATRNQVLQETKMPLGGGFQELLPGGRSGLNLSTDEAIQGLRLLSRKGGTVGDGAKQILKSPQELLDDNVFYGVQNALRKLQEKGVVGTAPVKNPEKYQAAAIANAIKEAMKKGE